MYPMKPETLRRVARWAQKISVAMADLSKELTGELQAMESTPTPAEDLLGRHILRARASYRSVMAWDKNKSGKKTMREVQTSFFRARELGFRPGLDAWMEVLRCGVTTEPPSAFQVSTDAPLTSD